MILKLGLCKQFESTCKSRTNGAQRAKLKKGIPIKKGVWASGKLGQITASGPGKWLRV